MPEVSSKIIAVSLPADASRQVCDAFRVLSSEKGFFTHHVGHDAVTGERVILRFEAPAPGASS